MLFNSYEFIFLFFPITLFLFFYFNKKKLTELGIAFLVFMSLVFYSYWNIKYLPLILGSIAFNFIIGKILIYMFGQRKNKFILFFGISGNVLLLCYFKYMDFLIENIDLLMSTNLPLPHIILPLGISFFTFTQIAYLVDCYSGKVKEYNFYDTPYLSHIFLIC